MPDRRPTCPARPTPLPRAAAVATATVVLLLASLLAPQAPTASADGRVCGALDLVPVDGGRYTVQNNRFGVEAQQCVTARAGGFTLEVADGEIAPGGPPKSYPSIVAGCHWGRCSAAPGLPVRAADVGGARTAVSITRAPGSWNAAYDLWFNSSPTSDGQNDGTEIMVWIDASDAPAPVGRVVGTVDVAGASWAVWQGNIGWDVVSFVREQGATTVDLALAPFVGEAITRGATEPGDWLTSVQFGFEPWAGGAGLAVRGFSFEPDGPRAAGQGEEAADRADGGDGVVRSTTGAGEQDGGGSAPSTVRDAPEGSRAVSASTAPPEPPAAPATTAPEPPAVTAPTLTAPPAPAPAPAPAPPDAALLVHGPSGLCLDARGTGAPGDPQVALWSCDPSQRWTATDGALVHDWTGACLGTVDGATSAGTAVQLQVCDGHPGQGWQATRTGVLLGAASGLCLGPRGGGASQGAALVLVRCAGAPSWS